MLDTIHRLMMSGGAAGRPPWPPPPRGPLPPFDPDTVDPESGAPLPVNTTLNFIGGPPNPRVRREQFCGLRVPGLPFVPGGTDQDTSLFLSWFFDRYGKDDQKKIVAAMHATGATHWTLSWPDSRGFGQSQSQFVETSKRLAGDGFWVCHKLFSKVYDPKNPDPTTVFPVLDALRSAKAITCATPAWETNFFVDPDWMDAFCDPLAQHAPELLWYLHFSPHYAAWQKNENDSPGAFWNRRIAAGFIGLEYQCEPVTGVDAPGSWTAGMAQARIIDVLERLCPGSPMWGTSGVDVIAWETTGMAQFNDPIGFTEDLGRLRGYETLCAHGPMPLMGYGNDASNPDGSVC
jgi:hypothetical protein